MFKKQNKKILRRVCAFVRAFAYPSLSLSLFRSCLYFIISINCLSYHLFEKKRKRFYIIRRMFVWLYVIKTKKNCTKTTNERIVYIFLKQFWFVVNYFFKTNRLSKNQIEFTSRKRKREKRRKQTNKRNVNSW